MSVHFIGWSFSFLETAVLMRRIISGPGLEWELNVMIEDEGGGELAALEPLE